jgi:hypothetical protein
MKTMLLAGALIDMFQALVVAREAPCLLVVVGVEDVALVLAEKAAAEIRIRLVVVVEAAVVIEEEEPVLNEQTLPGLRRPKKSWTPRWRIISTPTAEPQSLPQKLPQKLPRPAERLLRQFTLMIST